MNKTIKLLFRISTIYIFLLSIMSEAKATHVKGGCIGYKYQGVGSKANSSLYEVSVYLYINCNNIQNGFTDWVILGIFDGATQSPVYTQRVNNSDIFPLRKSTFSVCISNPPEVCYSIYTYKTIIELDNNEKGYNVNVQLRARVAGIVNIENSGNTGISLFAQIPGNETRNNSSPQFEFLDTVAVCHNSQVSIPFSATDADHDSLSYSFGDGLDATSYANASATQQPTPPPYILLNYRPNYNGSHPMGATITIDPTTGLISGIAPDLIGEYVIAVYVKEWRNGELIDSTKKELQIDVTNCDIANAKLNPSYINCSDYNFTFQNNGSTDNTLIYLWDFGVLDETTDVSTEANPTYQYKDTGTYIMSLKVGKALECLDSTTSLVKVYPGFFPHFNTTSYCITDGTNFIDSSYLKSGNIISWNWDFGDSSYSNTRNNLHIYSKAGEYTPKLTITSDKGCIDSTTQKISIIDKIKVNLGFTDTLICYKDNLQLLVNSSEDIRYTWSNNENDLTDNANAENPIVLPSQNTTYTVIGSNGSCKDTGYVHVNILSIVPLDVPDIEICIGDTAQFYVTSIAQKYQWEKITGPDALDNYTIKNPSLKVTNDNTFSLTVQYGTCIANKEIHILSAPLPEVFAGNDTAICQGEKFELIGTTNANNYKWLPNYTNKNYNVYPGNKSMYVFQANKTDSYCRKIVKDTVYVNAVKKIKIFAGNDTTLVYNQPITLSPIIYDSTHPIKYVWEPNQFLDNDSIKNPTLSVPKGISTLTYTVTASTFGGCTASDNVHLTIFQTNTQILVPSGFTPNNDGKNDLLKPIPMGLKKLDIFEVFNRWGDRIYYTNTIGEGWDGKVNNKLQPSGSTYIYHVKGIDYNNKVIDIKGSSVLIL